MTRLAALAMAPLLLSACVTTSTTTRTWGEPYGEPYRRYGRVEQVRETVHRQHGDPGAGAVAGAVVGGTVGAVVSGGRGAGGLLGAIFGAAVGANASQTANAEERIYEVMVRFEDGGWESFTYRGYLPFEPGDTVGLGPRGLERLQ